MCLTGHQPASAGGRRQRHGSGGGSQANAGACSGGDSQPRASSAASQLPVGPEDYSKDIVRTWKWVCTEKISVEGKVCHICEKAIR